jgi:hypothetical protein
MGRHQAVYQPEGSYLKSVMLWLKEYWTGPAVQVRPLRATPQPSRHQSPPKRPATAPNRRGEILDLPAFLPSRNSYQYERRKVAGVQGGVACECP